MCSTLLAQPRRFDRDGVSYQITLPSWGQWLSMLDRASRNTGSTEGADVTQLLRHWLAESVQMLENGSPRAVQKIDQLPAPLADALIAEGSAALEEFGRALRIETTQDPVTGHTRIGSAQADFTLKPLSFSERNACLTRNIGVAHGQPEIDAAAYEVALVAASIVSPEGLTPRDLMDLPLPLGEALVTAARALSDTAPEAELSAFAQAGLPHPDLELASLCLTFGITPQEAMALPAATARRLNAAARLLRASQPGRPASQHNPLAAEAYEDDRVTRIVVHDD